MTTASHFRCDLWLKFRRSRFKSRWRREFLKKFRELPEMRQLQHKRNFVQCKTGMPSSSVGKVFGHQSLSRWLKFRRSRFKSRWRREFLKNSENYLRCDNSSIKGTLCSAKPGCRVAVRGEMEWTRAFHNTGRPHNSILRSTDSGHVRSGSLDS